MAVPAGGDEGAARVPDTRNEAQDTVGALDVYRGGQPEPVRLEDGRANGGTSSRISDPGGLYRELTSRVQLAALPPDNDTADKPQGIRPLRERTPDPGQQLPDLRSRPSREPKPIAEDELKPDDKTEGVLDKAKDGANLSEADTQALEAYRKQLEGPVRKELSKVVGDSILKDDHNPQPAGEVFQGTNSSARLKQIADDPNIPADQKKALSDEIKAAYEESAKTFVGQKDRQGRPIDNPVGYVLEAQRILSDRDERLEGTPGFVPLADKPMTDAGRQVLKEMKETWKDPVASSIYSATSPVPEIRPGIELTPNMQRYLELNRILNRAGK